MVHQCSVGRVDIPVTESQCLEAEDRVAGNEQASLIVPTDLVKQLPSEQLAGARQHGDITVDVRRAENDIGGRGLRIVMFFHENVYSLSAQSHARVLDRAIRVDQFRPDDTDTRELCPADQLFQPTRMNHLDIIIEEQQIITAGGACSEVARGRVVERLVIRKNRYRTRRGPLLIERERIRIGAAVVDEDNLLGRIIGLVQQALDALSNQ